MPAPQKLKVFQTVIGLRTWVVATTSRKAALKAWDVHRDLFAAGDAAECNEPRMITAAMKSPGVPIPFGGPTALELASAGSDKRPKAKPIKLVPAQPKPDRSNLDAAEEALKAFRKQAASRRQAIEDEREDAQARWAAELKRLKHQEDALTARVAREKAAFKD
jgi:hypothetical protein